MVVNPIKKFHEIFFENELQTYDKLTPNKYMLHVTLHSDAIPKPPKPYLNLIVEISESTNTWHWNQFNNIYKLQHKRMWKLDPSITKISLRYPFQSNIVEINFSWWFGVETISCAVVAQRYIVSFHIANLMLWKTMENYSLTIFHFNFSIWYSLSINLKVL